MEVGIQVLQTVLLSTLELVKYTKLSDFSDLLK